MGLFEHTNQSVISDHRWWKGEPVNMISKWKEVANMLISIDMAYLKNKPTKNSIYYVARK
jgi:hypothetical protein